VRDCQAIRIWNDKWLTSLPLSEKFTNLFNIVRNKLALVINIFSDTDLNLSFCRTIMGIKLVEWHNMLSMLATVILNPSRDKFVWDDHKNGFSQFNLCSIFWWIIPTTIEIRWFGNLSSLWKEKVFMEFMSGSDPH
jgi:hypothetical protein